MNNRGRLETGCCVLVDGRVGFPLALQLHDITVRASSRSDGASSWPLIDVFALARLDCRAELILVSGGGPQSFAVPIRAVLEDARAALVVTTTSGGTGGALDEGVRSGSGPAPIVLLDVPGWTRLDERVRVSTIRAVTFEEFLCLA